VGEGWGEASSRAVHACAGIATDAATANVAASAGMAATVGAVGAGGTGVVGAGGAPLDAAACEGAVAWGVGGARFTVDTTSVKARLETVLQSSINPSCVGACISPHAASINDWEVKILAHISSLEANSVAPSSAALAVLVESAAALLAAACSAEGNARCWRASAVSADMAKK
jgi:hypothetical protein